MKGSLKTDQQKDKGRGEWSVIDILRIKKERFHEKELLHRTDFFNISIERVGGALQKVMKPKMAPDL